MLPPPVLTFGDAQLQLIFLMLATHSILYCYGVVTPSLTVQEDTPCMGELVRRSTKIHLRYVYNNLKNYDSG